MRRLRELRAQEAGFTLIELLMAMAIGLVVLMAAFMVLDRATSVSKEISDRSDALQRGRLAMETIVRNLRSQVCLGDETEPITVADDEAVTFYADLSDGSTPVEQRTIRYSPTTRSVVEEIYAGMGTYPELTFGATPTKTRTLIDGVEPILDGSTPRPVLRYYAFDIGGAPGDLELLPTPLSSDDAIRTVLVKIAFVVLPGGERPDDRRATTLESDVYVRLADPSTPSEGPRCI